MNAATTIPADQRLAALQALLHREVPLSRHMGVAADSYDGAALVLTADLAPNINIHGTAFGGSMYSLAALCGWALLRLRLEDLSLQAEVVVGAARIDYRRPVRSTLFARAACEARSFDAFADRVRSARRAGVDVEVVLGGADEGERTQAAVFTGTYAAV
ncbi:MAG: YiiD C-terminal domain-containing protein [Gammaproteobacteria bacterium]|nr:YiiD C-terminal domain-containing protein [Gammaproteobacteria bacterium]